MISNFKMLLLLFFLINCLEYNNKKLAKINKSSLLERMRG